MLHHLVFFFPFPFVPCCIPVTTQFCRCPVCIGTATDAAISSCYLSRHATLPSLLDVKPVRCTNRGECWPSTIYYLQFQDHTVHRTSNLLPIFAPRFRWTFPDTVTFTHLSLLMRATRPNNFFDVQPAVSLAKHAIRDMCDSRFNTGTGCVSHTFCCSCLSRCCLSPVSFARSTICPTSCAWEVFLVSMNLFMFASFHVFVSLHVLPLLGQSGNS